MSKAHKQPISRATRFTCHAPSGQMVFLAGTFNGWDPAATPKVKDARGNWVGTNRACPKCVSNPFGTMNRLVEVT